MSKILFKKKKGRIKIINRLSYPEEVNERVYKAIASGSLEGFLPLSIVQKRKETRIECFVQGLIPLTEYFNGFVEKEKFLSTVYQIVRFIINCDKNSINANNLDLQGDKIFIEPRSNSVKCIFWPIVNNQRDTPSHVFFKQLPYEVNFSPYENNAYLDTYKKFFNEFDPFSIKEFERLLLRLLGKAGDGERKNSGFLSEDSAKEGKQEKKKIEKNTSIEYDPIVIYCVSCGAKNSLNARFCIQCGNGFNNKKDVNIEEECHTERTIDFGTVVLDNIPNGTIVLDECAAESDICPNLLCVRTKKRFVIDKSSFYIGTERQNCDLFIEDNTYISRNHADIITRDGRFFIMDLHSTNRTYVDGRIIPAEQEIEIFSGTKIRLANEEFIFLIEP